MMRQADGRAPRALFLLGVALAWLLTTGAVLGAQPQHWSAQNGDGLPLTGALPTEPLTWMPGGSEDLNQAMGIEALAEFGGHLFAGMRSGASEPVLMWKHSSGTGWTPSSLAGFGGTNGSVRALAVYDGLLYAGTENALGAQVWSSGGSGWSHAADGGFEDAANHTVTALFAFQDRLFAGTANAQGAQIWAFDGLSWKRVVASGLGDAGNTAVEALAEYSGNLYAGTRNADGAQVWRTVDGNQWEVVSSAGFGDVGNIAVRALAVAHTRLYAAVERADAEGGQVWAYHAWTGWQPSVKKGFAATAEDADRNNVAITALASHDGLLFAGTANGAFGTQVWFSDGYSWWPSTKTGMGNGAGTSATHALLSHGGALWAGVENASVASVAWLAQPAVQLSASSRYNIVTAPNNLYVDVEVTNGLEYVLTDLAAYEFWETTGSCVYEPGLGDHLRWDIGALAPGQTRRHQFTLNTHSWCETQVVTHSVRLQGANLAPMFSFARSEVLAAPTATPSPTASPTPSEPSLVTLQQGADGYSGAEDTHLSRTRPWERYCQESRIRVGANRGLEGLIRFDLSALPASGRIVSATLKLYGVDWKEGRNIEVGLYAISRTVEVCEATWQLAATGQPWASAGCQNTSLDRRPEPIATFTTAGLRHWYAIDITDLVREWTGGELDNNGLLLVSTADNSEIHAFASSDHAIPSERPSLSIAYFEAPQATHTPTASATPTETRTPVATSSPTPTLSATQTATATSTPTPTSTLTCPDTYEPNDSFAMVWDIGWGGQVVSYLCAGTDVDYYLADSTGRPFDGFSITLRSLPANYDLHVYSGEQALIAASEGEGLADEEATVAGKRVYVRVSGAGGAFDRLQPYVLDVIPVSIAAPTATRTATATQSPTPVNSPTATKPATVWHLFLPLILRPVDR